MEDSLIKDDLEMRLLKKKTVKKVEMGSVTLHKF